MAVSYGISVESWATATSSVEKICNVNRVGITYELKSSVYVATNQNREKDCLFSGFSRLQIFFHCL